MNIAKQHRYQEQEKELRAQNWIRGQGSHPQAMEKDECQACSHDCSLKDEAGSHATFQDALEIDI
jgi:hypothetical protein